LHEAWWRNVKLIIFGLSITSSWGNGHATNYRGLARALHARGHAVTFFEQWTPYYAAHRDLEQHEYCRVVLYAEWQPSVAAAAVADADVVLVGSYCRPNEFDGGAIVDWLRGCDGAAKVYYDMDTPVTLGHFRDTGEASYLRASQLPVFDLVLSFTGGRALEELRRHWRAQAVLPFYCAVDPALYRPMPPCPNYRCALGYMGRYAADRQDTVDRLLLEAARRRPGDRFVVAGAEFDTTDWPVNVVHFEHLPPPEHPAFYSSNRVTLNATRAAMRAYGYCPSVRIFEAAACGAPLLSDWWEGLDALLRPDEEILIGRTTADAQAAMGEDDARLQQIGSRARARVLAEHTFDIRAAQLEHALAGIGLPAARVPAVPNAQARDHPIA
jgi:spore maturation protein CgeB